MDQCRSRSGRLSWIDNPGDSHGGAAMARTMKAAVVREFGKPLVVGEAPVPEPGPGQVQVKIEACGVCHTDLHAAEGDWPVKPRPPFIPGHEGVGFVSAVGRDVGHVKEGDRVGVPWLYSACGHCEHCLGGWETLCEAQQNAGYSVNGGFADYVVADPELRRPSARQSRLHRSGAGPVRRRDGLQGPEGHRHQARRLGGHLRHRRSRPHGRAIRPGHGPQRRRGRCRRRQARPRQKSRGELDRQRQDTIRPRTSRRRSAARTACW